jgi:non-structural maintenance of chromosomes element 4
MALKRRSRRLMFCLTQKVSLRIFAMYLLSVRNPTVANLDSKLLVTTSELAKTKARNMSLGDAAFNIDEYVSKLVSFMGGQHYTQATQNVDRGDTMDWAAIGRVAMRISRRPPTIDFMLGPLSVEKKERKVIRKQQHKRDNNAAVVRPQEV